MGLDYAFAAWVLVFIDPFLRFLPFSPLFANMKITYPTNVYYIYINRLIIAIYCNFGGQFHKKFQKCPPKCPLRIVTTPVCLSLTNGYSLTNGGRFFYFCKQSVLKLEKFFQIICILEIVFYRLLSSPATLLSLSCNPAW